MVRIEFSGETPLEALASLVAYGRCCACNAEVQKAAEESMSRAERRMTAETLDHLPPVKPLPPECLSTEGQDTTAGETGAPSAKGQDTPPWNDGVVVEDDEEGGTAPAYTVEQVRKIGTEAGQKYGVKAIKAILKEFQVPGMGALKPEQYSPFVERVKGLGGTDA